MLFGILDQLIKVEFLEQLDKLTGVSSNITTGQLIKSGTNSHILLDSQKLTELNKVNTSSIEYKKAHSEQSINELLDDYMFK